MKNVEERLRELPQMAESTGLQADEPFKRRILRAAAEARQPRRLTVRRLAPILAALVVLLGVSAAALPRLQAPRDPQPTAVPLTESMPLGSVSQKAPALGSQLALDVPQGSISIRSSANPSYRSIWAPASGGNFPLIGVNGRYYRLLTNPTAISGSLLGEQLGTVDTFTSEPALAGRSGIVSNIAAQGEAVYAVQGMKNALVAATVNGQMRVFQRVSFGDSALVGGESLGDTLKASTAVALELSGVGTINNADTARRLVGILTGSAAFLRAGGGESNQSLLIQLSSGLVIQLAVNGERLIACGTWACPEFFDAFSEALQ